MATAVQAEDRWQTIRTIWRDEKFLYQLLGGAALVGLGVLVGAALIAGDEGFWMNGYTELLSIGVTVFVLDLLARRREERREEAQYKARLIRELGSRVHDVAVNAAEELRRHGWLVDGSLQGALLRGASLEGAHLWGAHLSGASLWRANLSGASLYAANLSGADLYSTNLSGANLTDANLSGANLTDANLSGADLRFANLSGAVLIGADLSGANLYRANLDGANLVKADISGAYLLGATLDENTILPAYTKWTPDADITRFTDPTHPDFWRPEPGSVGWYPAEEGSETSSD
jgi:hypothetical protein